MTELIILYIYNYQITMLSYNYVTGNRNGTENQPRMK